MLKFPCFKPSTPWSSHVKVGDGGVDQSQSRIHRKKAIPPDPLEFQVEYITTKVEASLLKKLEELEAKEVNKNQDIKFRRLSQGPDGYFIFYSKALTPITGHWRYASGAEGDMVIHTGQLDSVLGRIAESIPLKTVITYENTIPEEYSVSSEGVRREELLSLILSTCILLKIKVRDFHTHSKINEGK